MLAVIKEHILCSGLQYIASLVYIHVVLYMFYLCMTRIAYDLDLDTLWTGLVVNCTIVLRDRFMGVSL